MYLDPHTYILFSCFCYSAFFMVRELSIAAEAYKSYENLKGSILQGTPLCLRKLPYIYTFKIFFFLYDVSCSVCGTFGLSFRDLSWNAQEFFILFLAKELHMSTLGIKLRGDL